VSPPVKPLVWDPQAVHARSIPGFLARHYVGSYIRWNIREGFGYCLLRLEETRDRRKGFRVPRVHRSVFVLRRLAVNRIV
jgi:hypothetical protein